MNKQERKFRVIKEFKYVEYGTNGNVDKRCKGSQQKDILKTAKIGDIGNIDEVKRNTYPVHYLRGRSAYMDIFKKIDLLQEITPAEDILKRMLEGKKVRDYDCNHYEVELLHTTVGLIEEEYDGLFQYGIGDIDGEPASGTVLSKEEYDYLKSLEKDNENSKK